LNFIRIPAKISLFYPKEPESKMELTAGRIEVDARARGAGKG
jgi:hypothetical protein